MTRSAREGSEAAFGTFSSVPSAVTSDDLVRLRLLLQRIVWFTWLLPLAQAVLAGLASTSSSAVAVTQSMLITAVLLPVVMTWKDSRRLGIAAVSLMIPVLIVWC